MKKFSTAAKSRNSRASGSSEPTDSFQRSSTRRGKTVSATGARITKAKVARAQLESSIEQTCREQALMLDALLVKLHHGIVGFPDRVLLTPNGRSALIEFKRPGEKPTKIQAYWHGVLRRMKHQVYVIDSLQAFRTLLTAQTRLL
jgi:VRR-NUC domain